MIQSSCSIDNNVSEINIDIVEACSEVSSFAFVSGTGSDMADVCSFISTIFNS